ncbi:FecR family protein [Chitinophaga lutea]
MKSERIGELIARKLSQAASREELEELERLLAESPEYRFMEEVIHAVGETPSPEADDIREQGWDRLEGRLQTRRPLRSLYRWSAAAAVLLSGLAGGAWWWKQRQALPAGPKIEAQTIVSRPGTTVAAVLPDGSRVWLNAGSELRYAADFMHETREVTLKGEAFFDVRQDEARPFIVHTADLAVQVLGTSFNVRAYDGDAKTEAAVISGKVQVMVRNNPEKKVVLLPREKLVLSLRRLSPAAADDAPAHATFQVRGLAASPDTALIVETAWRDRKLAFTNETFEEVARKMERQYDVRIVFKHEKLKSEVLSGVFEQEDLENALRLLQMTTGFHYIVNGKEVFISE